MATYNESGWTYNRALTTYAGVAVNASGVTLIVNNVDVTAELADRSLSVHVATQGNSLGTMDARLNDPAALPATEQMAVAYSSALKLFDGTIRSIEVDEHKPGTHLFAGFSAQDTGPDGSLPSAAPFGLSDTPNGTTTRGYGRLRKLTRTTEGGAVKTTYTATYRADGLWANMNVELTSTRLSLSALELTVVDATVRWPTRNAPEYAFELGEATVKLAQLVEEAVIPPDGSITETMIADNAISTPKLSANAVISQVLNVGSTVQIDGAGLAVSGGRISVQNQGGTVIIDGLSDMFRIRASGTFSNTIGAGSAAGTGTTIIGWTDVILNLLLDNDQAVLGFIGTAATTGTPRTLGRVLIWLPAAFGLSVLQWMDVTGLAGGGQSTIVRFGGHNRNNVAITWYCHYYVLEQVAI